MSSSFSFHTTPHNENIYTTTALSHTHTSQLSLSVSHTVTVSQCHSITHEIIERRGTFLINDFHDFPQMVTANPFYQICKFHSVRVGTFFSFHFLALFPTNHKTPILRFCATLHSYTHSRPFSPLSFPLTTATNQKKLYLLPLPDFLIRLNLRSNCFERFYSTKHNIFDWLTSNQKKKTRTSIIPRRRHISQSRECCIS